MTHFPRDRARLSALFFLQAHGICLWYVPFSNVLRSHGLDALTPYAFACSSVAAFISPMVSGTLADRHFSAERILRWLLVGGAVFLALTFLAIERNWGPLAVLGFLQMQQLCASPTWGLSSAIVLASLDEPARQFGPVRVWATLGWMFAGLLLSFGLHADSSTLTGFLAAAVWLGVSAFTLLLPRVPPSASAGRKRLRDLFGWDAYKLLRDRNHGTVLVTAALLNIPLAAFYPFAVVHLRDLGEPRVAAAMSLGQVTEIIGMFALAPLLARYRLKAIFLAGIAFGILRYIFFAMNTRGWVLAGITLHGFCFTLFFISTQIYLERRVEPQFRTRAQALFTVMTAGFGNFFGALATGWWRQWCTASGSTDWSLYWSVLCVATAAVWIFFAVRYRGIGLLHAEEADVRVVMAESRSPMIAPAAD